VLDLDGVIMAAGLPDDRTAELVAFTRDALARYDCRGMQLPELRQGDIGITASRLSAVRCSLPSDLWKCHAVSGLMDAWLKG